jgi:hypothetical protein
MWVAFGQHLHGRILIKENVPAENAGHGYVRQFHLRNGPSNPFAAGTINIRHPDDYWHSSPWAAVWMVKHRSHRSRVDRPGGITRTGVLLSGETSDENDAAENPPQQSYASILSRSLYRTRSPASNALSSLVHRPGY